MKRPKIKNQTTQPVLVPIPGMNDYWMGHVSLLVGAMLPMQSTLGKKYFTSCDPHRDIFTFSYWQIFWHSI